LASHMADQTSMLDAKSRMRSERLRPRGGANMSIRAAFRVIRIAPMFMMLWCPALGQDWHTNGNAGTNPSDHGGVAVFDAAGDIKAFMLVDTDGRGLVVADVKSFRAPNPGGQVPISSTLPSKAPRRRLT
jgi:hypothetical protein